MKKRNIITLICLALLMVSGASAQKKGVYRKAHSQRSIVILYENDVHCAIDGYQYMAGLRDAISDTAHCCLVSEGDFLQGGTPGALTTGKYIADIMQTMHYDAITLGNHEFDYGVPRMYELLEQIGAPVTSSNFRSVADNRLIYKPYIMKRMGRRYVAFVGVTTPTTLYSEAYAFNDAAGNLKYDLCENEVSKRVQDAVNMARAEGANYVILLSHVGEDDNPLHVTSTKIVQETSGIDVVLDGHTHSVVREKSIKNKEGKEVLVVQTGTKFANVGKLLIQNDGTISNELIPLNTIEQKSALVAHVTDSIKADMEIVTSQHICTSKYKMSIHNEKGKQGTRLQEMPVGNLVTDAYRIMTDADMAITNGGGLRTSMKDGDITYGDLLALLPFDNYLLTIEVTGQKLVETLNATTQLLPKEDGQFAQCSGIRYTIDMNAEPDANGIYSRVKDVEILEKESGTYQPIEMDKTYSLATIDYCVTGGGLHNSLKGARILKHYNILYSKAVIQYITDVLKGYIGEEYAQPQGRITIIEKKM